MNPNLPCSIQTLRRNWTLFSCPCERSGFHSKLQLDPLLLPLRRETQLFLSLLKSLHIGQTTSLTDSWEHLPHKDSILPTQTFYICSTHLPCHSSLYCEKRQEEESHYQCVQQDRPTGHPRTVRRNRNWAPPCPFCGCCLVCLVMTQRLPCIPVWVINGHMSDFQYWVLLLPTTF